MATKSAQEELRGVIDTLNAQLLILDRVSAQVDPAQFGAITAFTDTIANISESLDGVLYSLESSEDFDAKRADFQARFLDPFQVDAPSN